MRSCAEYDFDISQDFDRIKKGFAQCEPFRIVNVFLLAGDKFLCLGATENNDQNCTQDRSREEHGKAVDFKYIMDAHWIAANHRHCPGENPHRNRP